MQQMRQIKEMIALAMLAVSAYTDIREKNIYISPLVISASGAVVISLIQYLFLPGEDIIADAVILPAVTGIVLTVLIHAYRRHIGMGDAYLLAALGFVAGNRQNMYTITIALPFAAVYAVIVMISKRHGKWRHAQIPFAPFVMAGFIVALLSQKAAG